MAKLCTSSLAVCVVVCLLVVAAAAVPRVKPKDEVKLGVQQLPGLAGIAFPDVYIPLLQDDVDSAETRRKPDPVRRIADRVSRQLQQQGAVDVVDGLTRVISTLFTDEIMSEPSRVSTHSRPKDAEIVAAKREDALLAPRERKLHASDRNLQMMNATCSGRGVVYSTNGTATYQCNNTQLPFAAYSAVTVLQEVTSAGNGTDIKSLTEDVARVLDASGVQFRSLISNNTGIRVNLTQIFSGAQLETIETQLNITGNNTVVDVGELFQNGVDGLPVVNTTDLVSALPAGTIQQLIDTINCNQSTPILARCSCPVDFTQGGNCSTSRSFTCTVAVNLPAYQQCLATNGATHGLEVKRLQYKQDMQGDPPCLDIDPSDPNGQLQLPLTMTCGFSDGDGNFAYCNGTRITQAFLEAQAAQRNVSVNTLPGSPPFYDFGCLEQSFTYLLGAPTINGSGLSFSNFTGDITVIVRPYSFLRLSDASWEQSVIVPRASLVSTLAWNASFSLPVGKFPAHYFPGGRLYTEVYVSHVNTSSSSFARPFAVRVFGDVRGFKEGERRILNKALVIGLVVPFGVILLLVAFVWYRRRKTAETAAELKEMQQRVNTGEVSMSYASLPNSPPPSVPQSTSGTSKLHHRKQLDIPSR